MYTEKIYLLRFMLLSKTLGHKILYDAVVENVSGFH